MNMRSNRIEVSIGSELKYLELIKTITDGITSFMRFDDDTAYWIGMSVGESVNNAIRHGNRLVQDKSVEICFEIAPEQLDIFVRDQGGGFSVNDVPNPLDPENVMKPSGRGVFFICSFMDEVELQLLPDGDGMEVHMAKRVFANQVTAQVVSTVI